MKKFDQVFVSKDKIILMREGGVVEINVRQHDTDERRVLALFMNKAATVDFTFDEVIGDEE